MPYNIRMSWSIGVADKGKWVLLSDLSWLREIVKLECVMCK